MTWDHASECPPTGVNLTTEGAGEPDSLRRVPAVVATPDLSGVRDVGTEEASPAWVRRAADGRAGAIPSVDGSGLNNHQACLQIGVHPTTGSRWSKGRNMVDHTGKARYYPPVHAEPKAISPRYLSEEERVLIGDLLAAGYSQRSVAAQLRRSPSTISREVRRNISGAGNYRPFGAHRKALGRRPRPRSGKLAHDNDLRDFVQDRLEQRWSPQQICHALPIEFPGQTERHLVQETIYQALYVQGRGELRRELVRALRTGPARRKPHRRGDARRQGCIVDASVMISERPAEADDRAVPGHWEGDLVRHEALWDRAEVEDLRRCAVAAA